MKVYQMISVGLLMISSSAFAANREGKNVSFVVDSRLEGSRSRVIYDCSAVRSQTKAIIQKLGGTDVSVSCSGGLDTFNPRMSSPAFVRASFSALTQGQARVVRLSDRDNCHLAKEVFQGVRKGFVITAVDGQDTCYRSTDSYSFDVTTIAE